MIALLLACRPEVCTTDPDLLPVVSGTEEEATTLDATWQSFAEAVAPAKLCVTAAEVWSVRDWRVEGRYRSVRRNIWVGRDDTAEMATALRHELCHAFDQQVIGGRVPGQDFSVDVRLAGMHPGKIPAREAFAWTCSLEPTLLPAYAAASCDDELGSSEFAFVAEQVYSQQEPPPEFDVARLDATSKALSRREAIVGVEAFVEVPGAIGVLLDFDDGVEATEVAWIRLRDGRIAREAFEGPLSVLPLAPEGSAPLTSTLSFPFRTAASQRTEVALVETALLSGYVQRVLVRRDGGAWGAAPAACGIPLDARTTFFLIGSGRTLVSVSALPDNRLVVIGWDGTLG